MIRSDGISFHSRKAEERYSVFIGERWRLTQNLATTKYIFGMNKVQKTPHGWNLHPNSWTAAHNFCHPGYPRLLSKLSGAQFWSQKCWIFSFGLRWEFPLGAFLGSLLLIALSVLLPDRCKALLGKRKLSEWVKPRVCHSCSWFGTMLINSFLSFFGGFDLFSPRSTSTNFIHFSSTSTSS